MSSVRIGRDDFNPPRHHSFHDDESHHHSSRHHDLAQPRRSATLPIPDLRFEYTYLKNIRPHVRIERCEVEAAAAHEKSGVSDTASSREVVQVAWGKVLWITTKEQVISPLVQGILWGIVRWYFLPGAVGLGQSIRTWWKNGDALAARRRGGKQSIDRVRELVFSRTA
ncbi:hypothetical protein PHLGIDRAFT_19990 [Phlebiopsis gigantea 11061_1 CR5-6]|uniref:Uncharacterized protein n=1 Tax=Phlebiopsis gigantea (strain 11061_1 CR5-6) TaxID=745531 RepID=A0A0C3S6X6_PHLG1|nr:hypothetical protein PHLGIDRAFT_19990 [Phlebiopsis gigantea 11061_1 CR5-6]